MTELEFLDFILAYLGIAVTVAVVTIGVVWGAVSAINAVCRKIRDKRDLRKPGGTPVIGAEYRLVTSDPFYTGSVARIVDIRKNSSGKVYVKYVYVHNGREGMTTSDSWESFRNSYEYINPL